MIYYFDKDTTVEELKISICEYINENWIFSNSEDEKKDILEYLIVNGKTDVADYLIDLGMKYTDSTILQSNNLDFIKKYIDISEFQNSFFENKMLLNYFIKERALSNTDVSKIVLRCRDMKEQFGLLKLYIDKLTIKEISEIFNSCCNLYMSDDFSLYAEIVGFIFNYLKKIEGDDIKKNLSFISDNIKRWFRGDNYGIVDAYRNTGWNCGKMNKIHIFIMQVMHFALENDLLDPNLKTYKDESRTLFMEALKMKFPAKELELLTEKGADINFIDGNNQNYLFYCKTNEHTQFLLSKGLDAKLINMSGQTPLFVVNSCEQITMLVEAGTDPTIKSKTQLTAYDTYMKLHESQSKNNNYILDKINYKALGEQILKYLPVQQKFINPDTKLSDLSVDDLINFLLIPEK